MHDVLDPATMLADELAQRRESGYDVAGVEDVVLDALADGDLRRIEQAHVALEATELRADWVYDEPSSLDGIA